MELALHNDNKIKKYSKYYTICILFLVADWYYIHASYSYQFYGFQIRLGDVFFFFSFYVYLKISVNEQIKKNKLHYYYIIFIVSNIIAIYLGSQNTKLSYAIRDFQVVSLSVSFFVCLYFINNKDQVLKIIPLFLYAFLIREIVFLIIMTPITGFYNRILTLADTSQTSFIHNLVVLLLLYYFFTSQTFIRKFGSIILATYLICTIIMLGKMGGILTLSISVILFLLITVSYKNILNYIIIGIIISFVIYYVSGSELITSTINRISLIQQDINQDANSKWRLLAWSQGWDIFQNNILFGVGYSWRQGWLTMPTEQGVILGWGLWGSMLHNGYLHVLSSGGIIGALGFFIFILHINYFVIKNISKVKEKNDKLLIACFYASFASFLITAYTNPTLILFVSMVGWAFGAVAYKLLSIALLNQDHT